MNKDFIKKSKKKIELRGKGYQPMELNEMKSLQGSGNTQEKSLSEHNFAAKVLMKKSI